MLVAEKSHTYCIKTERDQKFYFFNIMISNLKRGNSSLIICEDMQFSSLRFLSFTIYLSLFSATPSCSLPISLVFGELLVRGYPVRMIFRRMPMFCWQPSSHATDTPSFLSTCTSLSLSLSLFLSFSLWVIDRSQCSWLWQLASWQTPHARTCLCVCVCVCVCGSFNLKF